VNLTGSIERRGNKTSVDSTVVEQNAGIGGKDSSLDPHSIDVDLSGIREVVENVGGVDAVQVDLKVGDVVSAVSIDVDDHP